MNVIKISIFISFLCSNLLAQNISKSAGTYSGLFLRFPTNPRASSMSEAFTALGSDVSALYYNPASLARMNLANATINHTSWFEGIHFSNIAFGYNPIPKVGIGFGFSYMGMPEIQGRNLDGSSTNKLTVSTSILNFSGGYQVHPAFYFGLGLKYFNDNLANYTATGVAFDLGLLMFTRISGLTFGLAIQNIGGEIQYDVDKEKIPLMFRIGSAYKIPGQDFKLALDITRSAEEKFVINFGGQYAFQDQFILRMGNRLQDGKLFSPTFGLGFLLKDKYSLDYSFNYFEELGAVHQFGFSFKFNIPYIKSSKSITNLDQKLALIVPPSKIIYKISKDKLVISWTEVTDAQYNVYARIHSSKKWTKLNEQLLSKTSMELKFGNSGKSLYVTVTAVKKGKESRYAKEVQIHAN